MKVQRCQIYSDAFHRQEDCPAGYICEEESLPEGCTCPLCGAGADKFEKVEG